jgi:hypothetical protein
MEAAMSDEQAKDATKRDRSPKFPYIGLGKAIDRIKVLHNKAKRYDVRVADIAKDWDLSPKSSTTDRTVAALQSFGLIEDSGSGENRKIKISELGERILNDNRPGVREELLDQAAIKPALIANYASRWGTDRPGDTHALSDLQFDGGFTAEAAKIFLRVFDETIQLTSKSNSDKNPDSPAEEARGASDSSIDNFVDEQKKPFSGPKKQKEVKSGMKEDVFSLEEGDVTLQWPSSLSADSYADLEDWTMLMLRKIKRSIEASKNVKENED